MRRPTFDIIGDPHDGYVLIDALVPLPVANRFRLLFEAKVNPIVCGTSGAGMTRNKGMFELVGEYETGRARVDKEGNARVDALVPTALAKRFRMLFEATMTPVISGGLKVLE